MILVCYDGSPDAQAAIDRAAELMPGADATVLTIWEPFIDVMTRSGAMGGALGMVGTFADGEKADEACRQTALETPPQARRGPRPPASSPRPRSPAGTAASPRRSSPPRPRRTPR